jgi:DNA-binding transcriptional LysR family regulator
MEKAAPQIRVEFEDVLPDTFRRLIDGQVDMAITMAHRLAMESITLDEPLSGANLFSDHFVLVAAVGNKAVGESVSYDELCELAYVETRVKGQTSTLVEQALYRLSKQPQAKAWFPTWQLTLSAVANTDMVGVVPSRLVNMRRDLHVRILPVPFDVPPMTERFYWHPRNDVDTGHRWFRDALQSVVQSLETISI